MTVSMGSGGSYVGLSWKDSSESSIHNVINTSACTLYAPLKSSLILSKGAGDPTWSRATKAWGFNELGYLEELASGCAFFGGARLVRNLVPTPSNTLAIAGTKTVTLTQAATLQFSMGAGAGTATFSGTGGATGTLAAGASRVSVNKTVTAGTFIVTASVDALVDLSIVDVTNYNASYIPEYVSVGVVATPFFGAGIDGAKYFETDWQGAPIAAANLLGFRREASALNNLLHSRDLTNKAWQVLTASGSELLANGTFNSDIAGWSDYNGAISSWSAGAISVVYSATTSGPYALFTTTVGKSYTVSAELISATGYTANTVLRAGNGVLPDPGLSDSAVFTAPGTKTISFVATGTTSWVYLRSSDGVTVVWDNVTVKESAIQPAKTATGLDGIANTATTLTATAADAVILQPISLASAARCASAYIKRRTGTGTISFTQDGGSTWTDITSLINSSTWSRVEITATLANPSVGFKISTSGDAIDVDCAQNEAGAVATSPIVTTTATVTRNADSLTYQTAGNIDFAVGTAYLGLRLASSVYGGYALSCTANGRIAYSYVNDTRIANYDGTNVAFDSPSAYTSGRPLKIASAWGGATKSIGVDGRAPVASAFDGSMGSGATIDIGGGVSAGSSYIGPVAIYNYQMTDAELQAITA